MAEIELTYEINWWHVGNNLYHEIATDQGLFVTSYVFHVFGGEQSRVSVLWTKICHNFEM